MRNIVKDYEDMNSTSIKTCFCRNNSQVKSGMMHLDKRKAYLTCNVGTRKRHIFNIECCYLSKLIKKISNGFKI